MNEGTSTGSLDTEAQRKDPSVSVLPVIAFYLIIILFVVWYSDTAKNLLKSHRWPIGISVGIIVLLLLIERVRSGRLITSVTRRIGLTIFLVIPILLGLIAAVIELAEAYQVIVLRSVFLLIVCLLPATMYYLFIASRKSSLFQEFFTNLSQLGLLELQLRAYEANGKQTRESELERKVRVMSYIKKFEAVYGPIPADLADGIFVATNPADSSNKKGFEMYMMGSALHGIFTPETTIPVVLATLLIGLGWLLTLPPWETVGLPGNLTMIEKLKPILQPSKITVHFAFLGAYFFSLQMLFRRYVRNDLRANAYIAVSMRIILAVIGTWVVIQAAPLGLLSRPDSAEKAMLVIGFVIGAFPPIAWQMILAVFRTMTGAKYLVPSLRSEMPVNELEGLTVWHEARLEEEDIENVPNMATADIVGLMLHTRISPDRIVDWVDQAMLYTQLGPDKKPNKKSGKEQDKIEDKQAALTSPRRRLGDHGIRTASALIAAYEKSVERNDVADFENILPGEGRSCIRSLIDTLAINPNLELVKNWRRLRQW